MLQSYSKDFVFLANPTVCPAIPVSNMSLWFIFTGIDFCERKWFPANRYDMLYREMIPCKKKWFPFKGNAFLVKIFCQGKQFPVNSIIFCQGKLFLVYGNKCVNEFQGRKNKGTTVDSTHATYEGLNIVWIDRNSCHIF